jgi:hypothetical protein
MNARTFWGLILIGLGGLLLLDRFGLLPGNAWGYIWPLALILLGSLVLLGVVRRRTFEVVHTMLPLDGAEAARVSITHGAGELRVAASDTPNALVDGAFGGGVEPRVSNTDRQSDVALKMPSYLLAPWDWIGARDGLAWDVKLTPSVPLDLTIDSGASSSHINLSDLQVRTLNLRTGASSVDLTMPEHAGMTRARIESGAASVNVRIPDGVAAHISGQMGLGALNVGTVNVQ